jgi:ATP-dependent protease Clp ATPase subunit
MSDYEIVHICDFCGKTQPYVAILIEASKGRGVVHICDECVDVCVEVVKEKRDAKKAQPA